ncbi:MAG: hypothetical protein ACK4GQ_05390, partial [Candidatus Hadarchaeales archaeon]
MKFRFASVCSFTKTGDIMRPKGPVSDPYLSWTSILKGEHVPLLWLKLRKPLNQLYHNYFAPQMAKLHYGGYALVSQWLNKKFNKFRNLAYITKFDVILVIVHSYFFREMANFLTEVKKMKKKPILLSTLATDFREEVQFPKNFKYFKIILDNCEAFLGYGSEKMADYLKLFTDTPIISVSMPYPFDFTKSFFKRREEKEKVILIPGHEARLDEVASSL